MGLLADEKRLHVCSAGSTMYVRNIMSYVRGKFLRTLKKNVRGDAR